MPPSSRYSRTNASPARSSHSGQTVGQTRINIVKRLAIEGKSERGPDGKADGASIRMYLRLSLPVNASIPGSTIPLFPEDNLKILDSQVHPLDNNAVPYNFSSTTSPLLHKAARALNLPARSKESYLSLFGSLASSSASSPTSSSSMPPLDGRYTGHVLVSQYQVSYVLPKEFPPRTVDSSSYGRRSSANEYQFMAAIDIWAPFVTKPPSYPYLLSLPVPRCLSNHIRLRIFPPGAHNLGSSAASLSSGDGDSWDLTSEPHVTRNASRRRSRTPSYQQFADDESSDSSGSGFADGYGIQGTFPSTDHMRVRWATPMKTSDLPEANDGRRRVGIKEAKGEMTCAVLGKSQSKGKTRGRPGLVGEEGILMKLEYSGTCKGVWFPGVATMLAMDVGLDAGDCDMTWAPGEEQKWTVSGGPGFTGFAAGPPPKSSPSKSNAPAINVLPSTPDKHDANRTNGYSFSSSSSKASLLRAPLPSHNPEDFSFESSPNTTPLTSVASLATIPSSPERRGRRGSVSARTVTDQEESRPPKVPLSIHLNINDLVPAKKNVFTFTISGTVLVIPRSKPFLLNSRTSPTHSDSDEEEMEPVALPQFRVLYAEKETITTVISNEMDDASLDIFNSKGRRADPQSRKTVLQPGGQTKCGNDGARLGIRAITSPSAYSRRSRRDESVESGRRTPGSRPRTPSIGLTRSMSTTALRQTFLLGTPKPKRDGALMIPNIAVHVLPLIAPGDALPSEYSVRMTLPAPSDADSEWLEFGLAQSSSPSQGETAVSLPPAVQIASASVEGVPVKFETSATVKPEGKLPALGLTFEETSTKEWITWVKVHVGEAGGGNVQVVYLVKADTGVVDATEKAPKRKKDKAAGSAVLNVLLPSFALPVGSLEVTVEKQPDLIIEPPQSNLAHRQTAPNGYKLLHYSLPEYFYPSLILLVTSSSAPPPPPNSSGTLWRLLVLLALITSTAVALYSLVLRQAIGAELLQARQSLESCSISPSDNLSALPEPLTVTTTVYSTVTAHVRPTPDTPIPPSSSSIATTSTTSTTPVYEPPPTTTAISTLTPILVASTTPLPATPSSELLSLRDLPFLWPVQFGVPAFEIPDSFRSATRVVMRGLSFAWQIWQKVYHFPA